jgi:hypothetical protein
MTRSTRFPRRSTVAYDLEPGGNVPVNIKV